MLQAHLRTVHFILLATCLTLAYAATQPISRRDKARIEEAEKLRAWKQTLEGDEDQHDQEMDLVRSLQFPFEWSVAEALRQHAPLWDIQIGAALLPVEPELGLPPGDCLVTQARAPVAASRASSYSGRIRTLSEFAHRWDAIREAWLGLVVDSIESGAEPLFDELRGLGTPSVLVTVRRCKSDTTNKLLGMTVSVGDTDPSNKELLLKARVRPIPLNMMAVHCGALGWQSQWSDLSCRGDLFANEFPLLAGLSSSHGHVPVDDLVTELTREGGQEVVLLGQSIPAERLSSWGLGLLLLVQFYFVLVYRRWVAIRSGTDEEEAGWLGSHDDAWSQLATAVSAGIVPIGAVIMAVTMKKVDAYPVWVLAAFSICAALTWLFLWWGALGPCRGVHLADLLSSRWLRSLFRRRR